MTVATKNRANLTQAHDILKFLNGGEAIFTLESIETGNTFTYKAQKPRDGKPHDRKPIFIKVLTGSDNTRHYQYFGFIDIHGQFKHGGNKAKISANALSVQGFVWFYHRIKTGIDWILESKIRFYHEGKCGKCGRRLTVPESIQSGLGPKCRQAMNSFWQ